MATEQEKQEAMKTARSAGAVSGKAIVPRVVRSMAHKGESWILDYGCGKDAIHAASLRSEGYIVDACDYSLPGSRAACTAFYDIVYLSNVLNVQSSINMLAETLNDVHNIARKCGGGSCKVVVNYPTSPRKLWVNTRCMEHILKAYFGHVVRLPKEQVGSNVVWCCQFPQYGG